MTGIEERFGIKGLMLIDKIVRSSVKRRWKEAYTSFEELKKMLGDEAKVNERWYSGALIAIQGFIESLKGDSRSIFRRALDMEPREIDKNVEVLRRLSGESIVRDEYDNGYTEMTIYILTKIKKLKAGRLA